MMGAEEFFRVKRSKDTAVPGREAASERELETPEADWRAGCGDPLLEQLARS
jgi:hypothetical protein